MGSNLRFPAAKEPDPFREPDRHGDDRSPSPSGSLSSGYQWFESSPLQRRVTCELDRPGRAHDLAHYNEPERIEPLPYHSQALCLIICEPRPVSHHYVVFEQPLELLPLRLTGNPSIWAEDKAGYGQQIEILA